MIPPPNTLFSSTNFEIFYSLFASSPGRYTLMIYGQADKDRYTYFDNFDYAISKVVKLNIVTLEDLLKLTKINKEISI